MGSGEEKPYVMCAEGFFSAVFTMVISVMAQIADVVCSKCLGVDKFVSVSVCHGVLNSRGQKNAGVFQHVQYSLVPFRVSNGRKEWQWYVFAKTGGVETSNDLSVLRQNRLSLEWKCFSVPLSKFHSFLHHFGKNVIWQCRNWATLYNSIIVYGIC